MAGLDWSGSYGYGGVRFGRLGSAGAGPERIVTVRCGRYGEHLRKDSTVTDEQKHKDAVKIELAQITKAHGGVLYGEDVIEFASDPATELYCEFEWDDTLAAHQYRLEQARHVIRVTVELMPDTGAEVKVYVSLQDDRHGSRGGYRKMLDVLKDPELR